MVNTVRVTLPVGVLGWCVPRRLSASRISVRGLCHLLFILAVASPLAPGPLTRSSRCSLEGNGQTGYRVLFHPFPKTIYPSRFASKTEEKTMFFAFKILFELSRLWQHECFLELLKNLQMAIQNKFYMPITAPEKAPRLREACFAAPSER